jgi:hypothetical protein
VLKSILHVGARQVAMPSPTPFNGRDRRFVPLAVERFGKQTVNNARSRLYHPARRPGMAIAC